MLLNKIRPRFTVASSGRRRAALFLQNVHSRGSSSVGSIASPQTTGSILTDFNVFDERDYEITRQTMHDMATEAKIEKLSTNFNEIYLDRDDIIGCLLRLFNEYAEDWHGTKRITRERMLTLLDDAELFDLEYTSSIFISDFNSLRKQLIKKKIYERKMKGFDFNGFIQCLEMLEYRLHKSKDEIFKRIIGSQVYDDLIKMKEIRNKIELGMLPSMETLVGQYHNMQAKKNLDRRTVKKKKKPVRVKVKRKKKSKSSRKSNRKKVTSSKTNTIDVISQIEQPPQSAMKTLSKDVVALKTLHIFEAWIDRDQLDKDLMNKLIELFKLAAEPFEQGLIRQGVLVQWLRASHVVPNEYSQNMIEGILSGILARHISSGMYKIGSETFEWIGFMDCVRMTAREVHLSLNEFVKRMLLADEFAFQRWRAEIERIPEIGTSKKTPRPWDPKKVLAAMNIMRDVVEESRKLHLTDDERNRLRSIYKEFAAFAYRRQSSHLEARLTNSVLSNWMRECRIFDEKYTINELDKDFISILGDFTLNGIYQQGTRDIDFDGFLILLQTIAAHKHIRADDLVQMIFAGPRSPLQKSIEFNEQMERTKIQTS